MYIEPNSQLIPQNKKKNVNLKVKYINLEIFFLVRT